MNKKGITFATVFLGLTSLLSIDTMAQSAVDSNYIFSGYTDRLAVFNAMPKTKGPIIFLGDSLTEAGRWKDICPELPVLNRGISGDISFGVLARLDEVLRHKPSKVILMIGVNDLKKGIPTPYIIQNYYRIIQKIKTQSPKTKIVLNSLLPVNTSKLINGFEKVTNEDLMTLNLALRNLDNEFSGVQFVDLMPVVGDTNGELRAEMTPDGIHLEMKAYVEVVNFLKNKKVL
ncbi:GDSL-type esterase/lipase family protein [Sphingobacterium bovistauri]|uniref:GDSL family lipase n=1 Tax=Sphingobacterium bovistauri TaxID=2781959 RepID=A0ABS7Z2M0_9SPHI|nr:GDSL-type esterase/lipase family protein [Sphingobacterium bovistauri]MCA5004385.1 GDSL family lipase [Sphingobacterium bovistauri]